MNAKAFMLLLGLAALAATGAYFIALQPAATPPAAPGSATSSATDARLAPALAERADEIATITISSGDADPVVLTRDPNPEGNPNNDRWLLASKVNFPVEPDRVRQLITTLAELRTVEPKTAKPELHERLAVQWPDPQGEAADRDPADFSPRPTLVSITDADGEPIAEIILGDTTYAGGGPRHYARLLDDNQSWLVSASVTIPRGPLGFVNTRFVELPRDSVRSVTITHADGETLELTRDDPEADFRLPDATELTNQPLANNTGNALAFVNFTDIADAKAALDHSRIRDIDNGGSIMFDMFNRVIATYETFDGLTVSFRIQNESENDSSLPSWVWVDASGTGSEEIAQRFGVHAFKLPANTIESLTRLPIEVIEIVPVEDPGPAGPQSPGLPPPTDD